MHVSVQAVEAEAEQAEQAVEAVEAAQGEVKGVVLSALNVQTN